MDFPQKVHSKIDKFPLLLGIIAIIVGGTALNLVNWQHKQLDAMQSTIQAQQSTMANLMAEVSALKAHISVQEGLTKAMEKRKMGRNQILY